MHLDLAGSTPWRLLNMHSLSHIVVSGIGTLQCPIGHDFKSTDLITKNLVGVEADPMNLLGKKGLRQKDRATQLALCAGWTALEDAGLPTQAEQQRTPERFAVVVSSNLGNLDTVCRVSGLIDLEGVAGTSPLDLPNASSNIVASCLAIRFGAKQVNLMVCNGSSSGLDAIHLARNLIAARRADRVLVVGVEVCTQVAIQLFSQSQRMENQLAAPAEAAIGVVLEAEDVARVRGATIYARIGRYRQCAATALASCLDEEFFSANVPNHWLTPRFVQTDAMQALYAVAETSSCRGMKIESISHEEIDFYGTLGVMQVAAAGRKINQAGGTILLSCGGMLNDGVASLLLHPCEVEEACAA